MPNNKYNSGDRTPAENELVKIHKKNLKAYLNMLRPIKSGLKSRAALAITHYVEIIEDDTRKEGPSHTNEYQCLMDLIADHSILLRDYDSQVGNCLKPEACLSDKAINLYVEKILQPLSDSTGQNVLFVSTEFYKLAEESNPKMKLNKLFQPICYHMLYAWSLVHVVDQI